MTFDPLRYLLGTSKVFLILFGVFNLHNGFFYTSSLIKIHVKGFLFFEKKKNIQATSSGASSLRIKITDPFLEGLLLQFMIWKGPVVAAF